jgi:hypothetical protein
MLAGLSFFNTFARRRRHAREDEERTVSHTLGQFYADMALDPVRLAAFFSDPQEALRAAGLSEADRAAVESRDTRAIFDRIATAEGQASALEPWNPPGYFFNPTTV